MSRSRNFQRSRRDFDTSRETFQHNMLERLRSKRAGEEVDREPIKLSLTRKNSHTIDIVDTSGRVNILLLGETAHVQRVS